MFWSRWNQKLAVSCSYKARCPQVTRESGGMDHRGETFKYCSRLVLDPASSHAQPTSASLQSFTFCWCLRIQASEVVVVMFHKAQASPVTDSAEMFVLYVSTLEPRPELGGSPVPIHTHKCRATWWPEAPFKRLLFSL